MALSGPRLQFVDHGIDATGFVQKVVEVLDGTANAKQNVAVFPLLVVLAENVAEAELGNVFFDSGYFVKVGRVRKGWIGNDFVKKGSRRKILWLDFFFGG